MLQRRIWQDTIKGKIVRAVMAPKEQIIIHSAIDLFLFMKFVVEFFYIYYIFIKFVVYIQNQMNNHNL